MSKFIPNSNFIQLWTVAFDIWSVRTQQITNLKIHIHSSISSENFALHSDRSTSTLIQTSPIGGMSKRLQHCGSRVVSLNENSHVKAHCKESSDDHVTSSYKSWICEVRCINWFKILNFVYILKKMAFSSISFRNMWFICIAIQYSLLDHNGL